MSNTERAILGQARSKTPLGVHGDAPIKSGLNSRASVYDRTTASEADLVHLEHLKKNHERARAVYKSLLEDLEQREADMASRPTAPGPKHPVVPGSGDQGGPATAPRTGPVRRPVVAILDEPTVKGDYLSSGIFKPIPIENEPVYRDSGWGAKLMLVHARRNVREARERYVLARHLHEKWDAAVTNVEARDYARYGAGAQMLGLPGEDALDDMRKVLVDYARRLLDHRKADPGKATLEGMESAVKAAVHLQLTGADDTPEAQQLSEILTNYVNTGELEVVTLPAESTKEKVVALVKVPSSKSHSGCLPEPYIVVLGDWLTQIAKRQYGEAKMVRGAEAIYKVNRETIGPDWNEIEVGMKLWIPVKP